MPGFRRFPLPLIAAFFALYVIWGSTYLVIRIGVEYWPPLMLGVCHCRHCQRQAGSAFKPFVYLTALESGYTPQTRVNDAPVRIGNWSPRNYSGSFAGEMTMANAVAQSTNTIAAGMADQIGRDNVARTARRLGGEDVTVVVRSGFDEMKASPWEKVDATHEGLPILNFLVPKAFTHADGQLTGVTFEKVTPVIDDRGRRTLKPTGAPDQHIECDDVLLATTAAGTYTLTDTADVDITSATSFTTDSNATASIKPGLCSVASTCRVPNRMENKAIKMATYKAGSPNNPA